MPRHDDFDEDDRPGRPRDGDDRPARPRREDEDWPPPPRRQSSVGLIIGLLAGVLVLCCGGLTGLGVWAYLRAERAVERAQAARVAADKAAAEKAAAEKAAAEKTAAAPKEPAEAELSRKNLKMIGIALHNHNSAYDYLPNNTYADAAKAKGNGRPLLSWRVHLLPFLEQENLYRMVKLDEPWDSPTNIKLLDKLPAVYTTPEASRRAGPGKTYYRGFSHRGAAFETARPPKPPARVRIPTSFPDGTSQTIVVLEAGEPVEWTKPDDLDWAEGRPRPALGGLNPDLPYVQALFADGSVAKMRRDVPDQTLRWLIDARDGNVIPDNWRYR
jgi:hypothetical protein